LVVAVVVDSMNMMVVLAVLVAALNQTMDLALAVLAQQDKDLLAEMKAALEQAVVVVQAAQEMSMLDLMASRVVTV
jgi:nucleotide-binding universal stress UspA family protein